MSPTGTFAGTASAFFGYSVAIDDPSVGDTAVAADGGAAQAAGVTAVVGALNDNGTKGAAYVYVLSGSTWSLQQELTAADGAAGDQFGYTVAVSGGVVLVGAAGKSNGQGAVYAFARSGSTWKLQQEFTSADGVANDGFGCALAIVGKTALIGAPNRLGNIGAAYLYTQVTASTQVSSWKLQQEFGGAASGDYFGASTALTPDTKTAAVGAFGASNQTGEVYVLTQNASGSWAQAPVQVVLKAADGQPGDGFGNAVAAGAGPTSSPSTSAPQAGQILVGAFQIDSRTPGAAYVFGGSGASWSQQAKLVGANGHNGDFFGFAVSLSGNTAVIGANQRPANTQLGSAYVFANSGGTWSQTEIVSPVPNADFGYAVAVSGPSLVVGAFNVSNQSGAAYLYHANVAQGAVAVDPQVTSVPALGQPRGAALLALSLVGLGLVASRGARGRRRA